MDEKTLRLLDKVTDKVATKIAERLVDKLGLRLADTIAQRTVERKRWASMTDEEIADASLRSAEWTPPTEQRGRR